MKILFVCGSLEPGHDGVGDYTRKLSEELCQRGHQVAAIALYDGYITDIKLTAETSEIKLQALRIPSTWSASDRFQRVKIFIDKFDPEWISFQFVIYSFHPKGLAFGLGKKLEELGKGRRCHIMFHELWIGFSKISPLKHRIVGFFQRKIIMSLIKKLEPCTISTSNVLYQFLLQKNEISAEVLPLFSNIPIAPADGPFVASIFKTLSIPELEIKKWIFTGIFGNLYPEANLESSLQNQLRLAESSKKKLAFVSIGRINGEGLAEFRRLEKVFFNRVKFSLLGEQPVDKVSNLLQILTTGISCTPPQHIGKSGVFAAMKLHGLNVLLPTGQTIPEYDNDISIHQQRLIERPPIAWSVSHIADQFIDLLKIRCTVKTFYYD
jgi:hypothetical protein